MISAKQCEERFGKPVIGDKPNAAMQSAFMVLVNTPADIRAANPVIPKRLFCHKLLVEPLWKALRLAIERGVIGEIVTWDGCFNPRVSRGLKSWSMHAWGLAIDINAATNGLGKEPTMSPELVKCFTDAGFDWGGIWQRKDGMHFQLACI